MRLEKHDEFPAVSGPALDGEGELVLPDDVSGEWSVLLFYRGVW